jgi:transcriptional regulator with XRE-family HTH domain
MSIGKNIAKFRKDAGLTQESLGELLGVTNQAVSKWESEVSMPDIMLLPKIAHALEVTLDDLFAERAPNPSPSDSRVLDMDAVRDSPKNQQAAMIDALYQQTNLVNCNSWDILKTERNPVTKKYDHVKPNHTLCCLSDVAGAAFVSDTLTIIDSDMSPTAIGAMFEKHEIASGIKKLADANVRRVLSHVCNEYFQRTAPFDDHDPEYFAVDIMPDELSRSVGISIEDVLEALEKLISLHIAELETNMGTHYLLHKEKAVEAAVTLRLIERLIHNEVACSCGEFVTLVQY